jgi:hypothetical protein
MLVTSLSSNLATAQEKSQPTRSGRERSGASIRGSVVLPERYAKALKVDELPAGLVEQVELPPPPLPENWAQMKPDEQNKWWAEFQESTAGKEFLTKRQELITAAKSFEIRIEPNGDFVVYDVPPGVYGLQGRVDKEINSVFHAFEIFGKLTVAAKTDEIVAGKIEITVTPLWENGQPAPALVAKTVDGAAFDLKSLNGKNVLVLFWLLDSAPSVQFQNALLKDLEEIAPNRQIELVSACLETDAGKVKKFLEQNPVKGQVVLCGGWNDEIAQTFGLRSFPSLWLIGTDQKLKMTDFEFGVARGLSKLALKEIIANTIDGKPIPNYPPPPPTDEKDKADAEKVDK